ncbi:MAG: NHL repeat-containing protein [Chitinivibrionales bacterium]|nr:NHL repeat-containing protein [Chitinivibrionales bacterium]
MSCNFFFKTAGQFTNRAWLGVLLLSTLAYAEVLVFPPYTHSYGIQKATQTKLFMLMAGATRFADPQGITAVKMKSRDDPTTGKDDDELVVYGVNSGKNQLIYNTSMWGLALFGDSGSGINCFCRPLGIAADADGHVFVADAGNNRIVHLYNPKKTVQWVAALSGKTANDSGFKRPSQVALSVKGNIYITDTGNRRIVELDRRGNCLKIICPDNGLAFEDGPTMLACGDGKDEWSFFSEEQALFCADKNGRRIFKFDFEGHVKKTIDLPGDYRAFYGACDFYHNLWVTDSIHHCILKFDHNLAFICTFGSKGSGKGQFIAPSGIAIWKRFGQTFIAQRDGAQYYWVGTECNNIAIAAKQGGLYEATFNCPEFSFVSVFAVVKADTTNYISHQMIFPGRQSLSFFLNGAAPLQNLTLRAEATYSSYTFYHWDYPLATAPK